MKQNKFLYGALGLLALGVTACSSDEPMGNGVAQQDETRYLRVNLVNPAGTRAAEFEAGTAEENNVGTVIMDFYDAAGNFIVRANPSDIAWDPENGQPAKPGNVGKIGSAVVKIGINKEQNLPAYVMCYLNPVQWGTDGDKNKNLKDLRLVERYAYKNVNNNFAMNNSCYYGNDAVTNQANVKISGTPIIGDQLYTSEAAAKEATASTVDIYVERYAAKVNFTANTTKQEGAYTEGGKGIYAFTGTTPVDGTNVDYSLDFNPEAWTINADAPSMYAVKNFAVNEANANVPTYDEVQAYLGNWNLWNDAANFRSYWSCSPAFFAKDFPQVSDQIADIAHENTEIKGNGQGVAVKPYELKYYSYNQICGDNGNGNTKFAAEGDVFPVKYALENTMGKPAFSSLNPKAAVPSVLLVGNYSVKYGDATIPANTSFYLFNNSLYFKTAPTGVDNAILMKDKFIADQQILYVKNGNDYDLLTKENAGAALNQLEVKHPDKAVRAKNLVPHRFVTLQLTEAPQNVYYRPNGAGEYIAVNANNLTVVNTLLWQQSGVAYSYTSGKCYFSIPIYHLGMTENKTDSPLADNGTLDWKKLRVGDMGLVRNHVYKLSVDAITGLATGIDNLDYPIVPPMDQDEYWIKYRINILNWRIVPAQGGIILK